MYHPHISKQRTILAEDGSAFATVLVLVVIISLFVGIILSGVVLQSRFVQKDIDAQKVLYAAEEGVFVYLNQWNEEGDIPKSNQFVLENGATIQIKEKPFGGFLQVESTASLKGQSRTIRVLIGDQDNELYENAIVMGDSLSNLSITGTTVVGGNIMITDRGVHEENYKGVPFTGSFDGISIPYPEDTKFPMLDVEQYEFQQEFFQDMFTDGSVRGFISEYDGSPLNNTFIRDTLYFDENMRWESQERINFAHEILIVVDGNFTLEGAYTFKPFTKIIVSDTLKLSGDVWGNHVLLYAGSLLEISGNASLTTQAMSRGSILISDEAYLKYPSMLYSSKAGHTGGDEYSIKVSGNSIVDGNIVFPIATNLANRELLRIIVQENAKVRGAIYNAGMTELEGEIMGTILTNQFYFYDSPTTYINWLKDVQVAVTERPDNFVIPIGFSDSTKFILLDWYELE